MLNLSLVIPAFNEEESLPELCSWIDKVLVEHKLTYEVILIDDGSSDMTWKVYQDLALKNTNLKGIRFNRNYGKSAALNRGFEKAIGDVVVTMDADLQDSPEELPDLFKMITVDGFDLVSGWKKKRFDPLSKTIPTKLYNWATRKMTGIYLHDFNCGLKAYKNEVVKAVEVYGEMHRYIPILAKRAGYAVIGEKVVNHQSRKYGTTKFGLERFINGPLDLLSITFVTKFGRKPMHLFGFIGMLMFMFGFLASGYIGAEKLYFLSQGVPARLVADNPWFYISMVAMILGTQLFLAGFIGELVSRNNPERNEYKIREEI
ncbi:MAG: glycosyltransferase family 2 protein [Salibacteraceae bacterium]|nr:glycosyltransferase family 2 protein [Salibacteraceae bacterium]|tara:strand:+ start:36542 stop:37492 length:951 start_codon:yes stop_codon:yes gene_type:complete